MVVRKSDVRSPARSVLNPLRQSSKVLALSSLCLGLTAIPMREPSGFEEAAKSSVFQRRQASSKATVQVGSEFEVNTYTNFLQWSPSVAIDADGDFTIIWQSAEQDGSSWGVYGQRYNSAGSTVGSEFQINTVTTGAQANPSIAMDADGDFVVVWDGPGSGIDPYGIFGQRFNSTGSRVGSEFQINSLTSASQTIPSVAMDAVGNFTVVWEGVAQDGSGYGIVGKYCSVASGINPACNQLSGDITINQTTAGDQRDPFIALDAAGNFVVAFERPDGSNEGINAVRGPGPLTETAVHTRILLHGALNTNPVALGVPLMRTDLQSEELLPPNQPYNIFPWNYNGTESVATFGSNVVDWVLVHLRATVDGVDLSTRSALLLDDGTITDLDGTSKLRMPGVASGSYFVVVEHRNHLSIINELGSGNLADIAGPVYHVADMNLDGQVAYIGAVRDQKVIIETLGTDNLADIRETNVP